MVFTMGSSRTVLHDGFFTNGSSRWVLHERFFTNGSSRQVHVQTEWTDQISRAVPVDIDLPLDLNVRLSVNLLAQVGTDRHSIELQRVPNPAERHLFRIQSPRGRSDPLQALAIARKVGGNADSRGDAGTQCVDPCRLPIDLTDEPSRRDVCHADAERIAVGLRIEVADEDALDWG